MRIREYYNAVVSRTAAGTRRGHPSYDEARRDHSEAVRARIWL